MTLKILFLSILFLAVASSILLISIFSETIVFAGKALNPDDTAKTLQVTILSKSDGNELTYDSFSRIGFVRSTDVEFLLESLPSVDKKPFYELVQKSLNSRNSSPMNIDVSIYSGNGVLIETLNYKNCDVTSYFVHVNDSKGKFRFLDDGKSDMEIRDITKFKCTGFNLVV
ncbi:MAG: hypothetical protein MAG458_01396 [Nitrosopumilus sp.]|nr:hypothetical protein [Nitrosopumilus sp.]